MASEEPQYICCQDGIPDPVAVRIGYSGSEKLRGRRAKEMIKLADWKMECDLTSVTVPTENSGVGSTALRT